MTYMFRSRSYNDDGTPNFRLRIGGKVPGNAPRDADGAWDSLGYQYCYLYNGGAYEAGSYQHDGLLYTRDGAVYVQVGKSAFNNRSRGVTKDGVLLLSTNAISASDYCTPMGRMDSNGSLICLIDDMSLSGLSGWWSQQALMEVGASASERQSQWSDSSGNARHLLQATGANQPILLPWSGVNYVWDNMAASNSMSAPDVTITGNVSASWDGELNSYAPSSNHDLVSKFTGTNGFLFRLNTTGNLQFFVGDGAALTTCTSTATVSATAFSRHTLRADYIDGGSGTVKFYVDGVQLGNTVNTTKTLTNQAKPVVSHWQGKGYSLSVTNGGGTTYYNSSPSAGFNEGASSYTGQDGRTWSINSVGATPIQIVGSPQIVGDGAAYFMRASYTQAQPVTRFFLARRNLWNITTAPYYTTDGVTANRAAIYDTTGTPKTSINAGTAVAENTGMTLAAWHAVCVEFNGASSSYQIDANAATTGNANTGTTGGLTIMADGGTPTAGTFSPTQFKECIEFGRSLSATEKTQVLRYLSRVGALGLAL